MSESPLKPRPGILDIKAYVGGEAKAPGAERVIRLASNENPFGPSDAAVTAYRAGQEELHRYPEGGSFALRETAAALHGIAADQIVFGAGSDELIGLLVKAYAGPGDEVLYSAHGFLMYAIAAKGAGATPVAAPERSLKADIEALLARVTPATRIVFIANPNNPTGSYLTGEELRRLRNGLPERVLLVIDAAYAEYADAPGYESGLEMVEAYPNVVMLRTFSKIYGLAGLRLGWAYCPPAVADVLNRLRGPFNVSAPAQGAGVAALQDQDHVDRSRAANTRILESFRDKAQALGLKAYPSAGNFVLLRFSGASRTAEGDNKAAEAAAAYLKARGILVRQMAGYGLPDCLRVTIGTEEDMDAVVTALGGFLS